MNSERREEMISAYLDGELSVDQRAQVETWMAESPELRQLHDELKALGASIRALPRHQLDQDLKASVLRRAEQSVLAGGAARPPHASDIRPASNKPIWLRGAGWRRLAWPAVAIAAALVVMFFDGDERPAPREVAHAPQGPTSIRARPDAPKLAAEASPQGPQASPAQTASATAKPAAAMSRSVAAPGEAEKSAATDAAQPAAGALGGAADEELKETEASVQLETVVYQVSPDFLRDNSLEKMLARSQIAWAADNPVDKSSDIQLRKRDQPATTELLAKTATASLGRKVYVVRVSDEQRERILGELSAKAEQVKKNENLSFGAAGAAIKRSAAAIAAEESRAETLRADESDSRPKKVAPTRPLRIVLEAREQSTTPPADPDDKP